MEVHHHSHGPKKIKEYITEFIMLFAAVTLGFFAENLREHQVEKHREVKYLENIHFDLERDMEEIDKVIEYNTAKQKVGSELAELYKKGVKTDLPRFYYLIKTLSFRSFFEHSSNGLIQLKNAGGLRMIEEKEIIKQIQLLELRVAKIESLQQSMDQTLLYFKLKTIKVLDAYTSWEMNQKQVLENVSNRRFSIPDKVNPLQYDSDQEVNELVSLALTPVNSILYINNHLKQLKTQCKALDEMLLKKFGSEFEK